MNLFGRYSPSPPPSPTSSTSYITPHVPQEIEIDEHSMIQVEGNPGQANPEGRPNAVDPREENSCLITSLASLLGAVTGGIAGGIAFGATTAFGLAAAGAVVGSAIGCCCVCATGNIPIGRRAAHEGAEDDVPSQGRAMSQEQAV